MSTQSAGTSDPPSKVAWKPSSSFTLGFSDTDEREREHLLLHQQTSIRMRTVNQKRKRMGNFSLESSTYLID